MTNRKFEKVITYAPIKSSQFDWSEFEIFTVDLSRIFFYLYMATSAIIFPVTASLVRWSSFFSFLTFKPWAAYLVTISFTGVETG